MFQCQSIWILLVYHILKGKREEEKWAGVIKRDGEFEKSLDKMLKKFKRLTWWEETVGETLTDTERETEDETTKKQEKTNRSWEATGKEKRGSQRQSTRQEKDSWIQLGHWCLGLWIDMERDEDSSIHASYGASSLGPLHSVLQWGKANALCQRRAY